jgi:hypothetical protein
LKLRYGIHNFSSLFPCLFFWAKEYGHIFPMLAVIAGVSPWMYMVLVINDFGAIKSILFAVMISTILVWLSILIFS